MSSLLQKDSIDKNNIFSKKYTVRYSETGANGRITCPNILNYFQDIATSHAGALGISALDLIQNDLAWVIYQLKLIVYDYPTWDTQFYLSTWRYPHRKLYELRAFEGKKDTGQILFTGKCAWVMIQLDTKKPVRLNRNLPDALLTNFIEIENNFISIAPLEHPDIVSNRSVCMHHLDFNRHVNNTIYAQWAIENVPLDVQTTLMPSNLDITFYGDAVLGDDLQCLSQCIDFSTEPMYNHQIIHTEKNTELTRIHTQWKKYEYAPV
ncbi:MAG: hypothetical protein HQK75_13670 [Candidatus Magnetomorum sp.]|nr:hypothetical protein [Candidatus Magnetomorum sp.]